MNKKQEKPDKDKMSKNRKLNKELENFDIEAYLQRQPNHTWLDWEREEQVITDLEELEESDIDEGGREEE